MDTFAVISIDNSSFVETVSKQTSEDTNDIPIEEEQASLSRNNNYYCVIG